MTSGDRNFVPVISKTLPTVLLAATVGFFAIVCAAGGLAVREPRNSAQKESSYFPLSVGNWWVYVVGKHSKVAGKTIKWSVTQREIVHGTPVYHLWQTPAQDDEPLSLVEVDGCITEADTERILLKDPLHSGERWIAGSTSLRSTRKLDDFEVVSAGKACSVGELSFEDCAAIREIDEANNVASVTTYARGVGPVKYVYFKTLHSEEIDTTLTIKSWGLH